MFLETGQDPTRTDGTTSSKNHKIDGCGYIMPPVDEKKTFNLSKLSVGRKAELLIDHGQVIVTDLETGEILAGPDSRRRLHTYIVE